FPLVGDFDRDGDDEPALYRRSSQYWYLVTERGPAASSRTDRSTTGAAPRTCPWSATSTATAAPTSECSPPALASGTSTSTSTAGRTRSSTTGARATARSPATSTATARTTPASSGPPRAPGIS